MNTSSNTDLIPKAQPPAAEPSNLPLPPEALQPAALVLPPMSSSQATAMIEARPLAPPAQPRTLRRNGRIARLPKLERDMVCRMLSNGVPYKQIVGALGEVGFDVTERNISNWATGGYLDWRLQQEQVLQNRLAQEDLLDYLRREDASELPEVGLQAAATRLSQSLLQKAARGEDLEANPGAFASQVNLLCRLNRELFRLQKYRDDCARNLGRTHDPARIRQDNDQFMSETELTFSHSDNCDSTSSDHPNSQAPPPAQLAAAPVAAATPPSGASSTAPDPAVSAAPGQQALPPRPSSVLTPAGLSAPPGPRPEPLPPPGSPPVGPGRSW